MPIPDEYPGNYRQKEVLRIQAAIQAGECVLVLGLSGSGKSNLLKFLAKPDSPQQIVFVDGNRLTSDEPAAFFALIGSALGEKGIPPNESAIGKLESLLKRLLSLDDGSLCLAMDLSMPFSRLPALATEPVLCGRLRSLRDEYKYRLTYILAMRHPIPAATELSELFMGNTIWLNPLSTEDARWSVNGYSIRRGLFWEERLVDEIVSVSGAYPGLLRAVCEAVADGCPLLNSDLGNHPAVKRRVEEFWADQPTTKELEQSGLMNLELLHIGQTKEVNPGELTAKEHTLLMYFRSHPEEVCSKDDLIRAVWAEDKIFEQGVRDDSLAQLIRRLREKIELDAGRPLHILTVPGRGYRFKE